MGYNKTLNFLNWSEEGYHNGNLFLFPTPVNYTLIGEAVKTAGFLNYTINGDKLTLDYGNNTRIELTINTFGISTIIEKFTNSTTIYRWELNTADIIVRGPFEFLFLTIPIAAIVALIIIIISKVKKKTSNRKENNVV